MSEIYYISVNCTGHHVYEVVGADSEQEAIEAAEQEYQCDETQGEYNETLDESYADSATRIEL